MEMLRFALSAITEQGIPVDVRAPVNVLRPDEAAEIPLDEVNVSGRLWAMDSSPNAPEVYFFKGRISGTFRHACDRCLDEAEHPFETEVFWSFEEGLTPAAEENTVEAGVGASTSDPRVYRFDGPELRLAGPVWEEAALAAPAKYLCKADCAGLCPHCGANWNYETCTCSTEDESIDAERGQSGLAKLADLFPDLRLDNLEE